MHFNPNHKLPELFHYIRARVWSEEDYIYLFKSKEEIKENFLKFTYSFIKAELGFDDDEPQSFKEFKKQCEDHGYETGDDFLPGDIEEKYQVYIYSDATEYFDVKALENID